MAVAKLIDNSVLWLFLEAASLVAGHTLTVDGGMYAQ
ncbi:MAG: hypothetical protein ETSY2_44170 [Candidatus Entotheonella gemina]|uniref:Short-chain dehydrogenase n=1 Tax=Candidatus Entotheonella gemina TaxID=1429439 RepID=W4LK19_9BACT|nr:MAG: hypothetical protein ETSY2_44170 [Candidatus Entotheonella gemina]